MTYADKIKEGIGFLKNELAGLTPETAIVLGSGLGSFSEEINIFKRLSFKEIPHFKSGYVKGHNKELIIGKLGQKTIVLMNGRIHYYEGNTMADVTYPIRVFQGLGIKNLILTNAAGGLIGDVGQLMLIKDHLSFFCPNPLIGENLDEFGERFPDASNIYTQSLRAMAKKVAEKLAVPLNEGVYGYMTGPMYETPSEIKALRLLGADCVGMSTVPEAIVAAHGKTNVIGISCITNMAAGITGDVLSHEDVIAVTKKVSDSFKSLLKGLVKEV